MLLEKLDRLSSEILLDSLLGHPAYAAWTRRLESKRGRGRGDYPISSLAESLFRILSGKLPSFLSLPTPRPSPFSFSRFLASVRGDLDLLLSEMAQPGPIAAVGTCAPNALFLYDADTGLPFAWEEGGDFLRMLEALPPKTVRFLLGGPELAPFAADLWNRFSIRPIIPLPAEFKETFSYKGHRYDERGEVFCPGGTMMYGGFEEKRNALKYLCPARHYGIRCKDWDACPLKKNLRIPLEANPAILTPLPRFSQKWQRLYALYESRSGVEAILKNRVPSCGNQLVYLRAASVLFAAAFTQLFSGRRK